MHDSADTGIVYRAKVITLDRFLDLELLRIEVENTASDFMKFPFETMVERVPWNKIKVDYAENPFDYGILLSETEKPIGLGKEIICISHTGSGFSLEIGFVSKPHEDLLIVRDIYSKFVSPYIFISDKYSCEGSSGSPVFDNRGRIINVIRRRFYPFNQCIPLERVRIFCQEQTNWEKVYLEGKIEEKIQGKKPLELKIKELKIEIF